MVAREADGTPSLPCAPEKLGTLEAACLSLKSAVCPSPRACLLGRPGLALAWPELGQREAIVRAQAAETQTDLGPCLRSPCLPLWGTPGWGGALDFSLGQCTARIQGLASVSP